MHRSGTDSKGILGALEPWSLGALEPWSLGAQMFLPWSPEPKAFYYLEPGQK